MEIHKKNERLISLAKRRRGIFLALAVTCIVTWNLSSWAQSNDAVPYPTGNRQLSALSRNQTKATLQPGCRMASSGQRERREVMQCRYTRMSEG